MILYKGNSLVRGKHFILDNELIEYQGKVFGQYYDFTSGDTHIILDESELVSLQEYSVDTQVGLRDYIKDFTNDVGSLQPLTEDKYDDLLALLNDCKAKLDSSDLVFTGDYANIDIDRDKFGDFFINYIRDCNLNLDKIHLQDFYSQIVSCINYLNSIK